MQTATDFAELLDRITGRFMYKYEDDPAGHVRMVGVVFARPNSPLTKAEIVPQINDWHYRSGEHIDFIFAGYTATHPHIAGYIEVAIPGSEAWFYSAERFDAFRKEFESRTTWKYGGSAELLLLNAHFHYPSQQARLDFSSMVCCQLDLMKTDQAIQSVERFFESVFRFAESADDTDPTWSFSDRQGLGIADSALKHVVLSLLPRGLDAEYKKAKHFAVRDVARA